MPIVDRTQMMQVFQNLISNAVKFRSRDDPVIRIDATTGDGEWIFSVGDKGIGIDPQFHNKIFDLIPAIAYRERIFRDRDWSRDL